MANNIFIELLPPWVETGLQPAFYDKESGTVLQQTARMYAKVNELTAGFNTFTTDINETVTEYIEKFNELYDYVHDYFDNLDVQEEINNKLDVMAEDGTLSDLISVYLNSIALFGYDTVADMKSAINLVAGSYAHTLGFYNINDGGDATYKIREITNDDTVDEKFIIAIGSGNLIAELITSNKVNICQVGGQQNFSTVCNYLLTNGKSVYIPNASFSCSSTIVITNPNTEFICDGDISFTGTDSTFIQVKSNDNVIKFNKTVTCGNSNVFMEVGASENARNNDVYVNTVVSSKIGLLVNPDGSKGVQYLRFTFNKITANEKGIYFNPGNNSTPWINANTFIGGEINAPYGIVTKKGANQTDRFNDNLFSRIGFGGAHIQCALDLHYMQNSWFDKMRIVEGLEGATQYVLDSCRDVRIYNEGNIQLSHISSANSPTYSHNTFKGAVIVDSGNSSVGNFVDYVEGFPYIPKDNLWNPKTNNLYSYSDSSTTFTLPEYYFNDIIVNIGADGDNLDLVYTLPKVFSQQIKSFYLNVINKSSTTKMSVKTSEGTFLTLARGSAISNKLYHCVRGGSYSSTIKEWKVTEVTLV